MGVYVYCVAGPGHPPPGSIHGVHGAPVQALTLGPFSVWLSRLDRAPRATLEGIRAHNAVVESAAAEETPLPFRFGQWFETDDALVGSLREREDQLVRQLRHVEGALEHGLRIIDPGEVDTPPDRSSGTAYLEGLAQRARRDKLDQDRGRELVDRIGARLEGLVRDQRVRYVGGGTLAVIAYLVARHDTGDYRAIVSRIPDEWPDLRFHSTGPWPPYGFVE